MHTSRIALGLDPNHGVERTVVRMTPDGRLPRSDAARYLGVTAKTLAKWACEGRGPTPVHVGSRAFYWLRDLDALINGKS